MLESTRPSFHRLYAVCLLAIWIGGKLASATSAERALTELSEWQAMLESVRISADVMSTSLYRCAFLTTVNQGLSDWVPILPPAFGLPYDIQVFPAGNSFETDLASLDSALLAIAAGNNSDGSQGVAYDFMFDHLTIEGGHQRRLRETASYLRLPTFATAGVFEYEWAEFTQEGLAPFGLALSYDLSYSAQPPIRYASSIGLQIASFLSEYQYPRLARTGMASISEAANQGLTLLGPTLQWCAAYSYMTTSCSVRPVALVENGQSVVVQMCQCGTDLEASRVRFTATSFTGLYEVMPEWVNQTLLGDIKPFDPFVTFMDAGLVHFSMYVFEDLHSQGCCGDHAAPDIFGNLAYQFQETLVGLYYYEHRMTQGYPLDWGSISLYTGWFGGADASLAGLIWGNASDGILGKDEYWSVEIRNHPELASRLMYLGEFYQDLEYSSPIPGFTTAALRNFWRNVLGFLRPLPPANVVTFAPFDVLVLEQNKYSDVSNWLGTQTVAQRRELIVETAPFIFDDSIWGLIRFNRHAINIGRGLISWQDQDLAPGTTVTTVPKATIFPAFQRKAVVLVGFPSLDARMKCLNGSYTTGLVCTPCRAGTFGENVSEGYLTTSNEAEICKTCESAVGTSWNETGATTCLECPSGYYQDTPVTIGICTPCPAGTYQPDSGSSACIQCDFGQYSGQDASTSCSLCELGRFNDEIARSECTPCNLGAFASLTGSTACTLCARGSFQDSLAQSQCTACASVVAESSTTQLGSTSPHDCMCPGGTLDPRGYGSNGESCSACPKGMSCQGQSRVLCPIGSDLPTCTCAEIGTVGNTRVRDCVDPETGVQIGCPANIQCNNATVGIDFDEDAYAACPQSALPASQLLESCSLSRRCMWALALCYDEAGTFEPIFEPQDVLVQGYYSQVVPAVTNVTDGRLVQPARFDLHEEGVWLCATTYVCPGQLPPTSDPCDPQHTDVKCGSCRDDYVRYGSYRDRCKECNIGKTIVFPVVFILCVIVVVACQHVSLGTLRRRNLIVARLPVLSVIAFMQYIVCFSRFSIVWPHDFQDIASTFSPLLLDFTNLYFGCFVPDTAFAHYTGSLFMPLLLLVVVFGVSVVQNSFRGRGGDRHDLARKLFNTFGMVWLIFFPGLAVTTMSFLECYRSPNSRLTMRLHPSVECPRDMGEMSGEDFEMFNAMLPLFVMGLTCFLIGFTALTWVVAFSFGRHGGKSPDRDAFGFIMFRVRSNKWFAEPLTLTFWIIFSCVYPAAPNHGHSQLLFTTAFMLILLVIQQCQQPYAERAANVLSTLMFTFMIAFATTAMWIPFNEQAEGSAMGIQLRIWFLTLIVLFWLTSLWFIVKALRGPDWQSIHDDAGLKRLDMIRSALTVLRAASDEQLHGLFKHAGYLELWHLDVVVDVVRSQIEGDLMKTASEINAMPRHASMNAFMGINLEDAEVWV